MTHPEVWANSLQRGCTGTIGHRRHLPTASPDEVPLPGKRTIGRLHVRESKACKVP